jgi:hypothetical protein
MRAWRPPGSPSPCSNQASQKASCYGFEAQATSCNKPFDGKSPVGLRNLNAGLTKLGVSLCPLVASLCKKNRSFVAPLQGAAFGGAFTQGGAHGGVGRGDLAYKSDESDESDMSIGRIGRIGHIDQKWRGRSAGILAGIQPTKIKTNQRLKPTTGKQAP